MIDVNYKPGLTLDTPISVEMAAADWLIIMNWFSTIDTDGVNYLLYGKIAQQVMDKCYDQASVKAAKARMAERETEMPPQIAEILKAMGAQVINMPRPEEFAQNSVDEDNAINITPTGEPRCLYAKVANLSPYRCDLAVHDEPRHYNKFIGAWTEE